MVTTPNIRCDCYTFQGQERDDEVKGSGNSYDFGARMYDSRLGRWLSIDPLVNSYPFYSPYHYGANSPILMMDTDGERIKYGSSEKISREERRRIKLQIKQRMSVDWRFAEYINNYKGFKNRDKLLVISDIRVSHRGVTMGPDVYHAQPFLSANNQRDELFWNIKLNTDPKKEFIVLHHTIQFANEDSDKSFTKPDFWETDKYGSVVPGLGDRIESTHPDVVSLGNYINLNTDSDFEIELNVLKNWDARGNGEYGKQDSWNMLNQPLRSDKIPLELSVDSRDQSLYSYKDLYDLQLQLFKEALLPNLTPEARGRVSFKINAIEDGNHKERKVTPDDGWSEAFSTSKIKVKEIRD